MTKGISVLLVDDSADDRLLMREQLKSEANFKVELDEAESAEIGLDMLMAGLYDCVIIDYKMPGRDGLWLIQMLNEMMLDVPTVMLTGEGDERIAASAIKNGAQEYLSKKEIGTNLLLKSIYAAIESKREELKNKLDKLQDPVTGVYTQGIFWTRLREAITRAKEMKSTALLIYLDFQGYEEVLDKHGEEAANALLREAARRVFSILRACDTMARLHDDHFIVLMEDLPQNEMKTYVNLAEKILHTVRDRPLELGNESVMIGANMGVAIYPDTAKDSQALFEAASKAMSESSYTPHGWVTVADDVEKGTFSVHKPAAALTH